MEPYNEDNSFIQLPEQVTTYLCLNPFCNQLRRIFVQERQIKDHQECSKWIIDIASSQSTNKKLLTLNNAKKFIFDMEKQPIHWIFNSIQAKDICRQEAKKYIQNLRQKIGQKLNNILSVIEIKIDVHFDPLIEYYKKIKDFISQMNSSQIKFKPQYKIYQIIKGQNISNIIGKYVRVFNVGEEVALAQQQIIKEIDKLTQKIFCYQDEIACDIGISALEKAQMIKYMKNSEDDHNKRWHKISLLLKAEKKLLYDRKPRNSNIFIKCPICPVQYTSEVRKQVMSLWNIFSDHILLQHLQQVSYHYKHLVIGNKYIGPISVQQILYKMINYSYESLQIICRSGRKNYNFFYTNRKKLSFDILSKGQFTNLPIQNIEIVQSYQLYSIISVIAYTLHKSRVPEKLIYVFTNSQTQINNIRKLNELFCFDNIRIVTQKNSEDIKNCHQDNQTEERLSQFIKNNYTEY